MSPPRHADRLRTLYQAFNDRDLDAVTAAMTEDVDWPNGWEGGRLAGRDQVRRYWERQWATVRATAVVRTIQERPDGTVEVRVRQVFRGPDGTVLERSEAVHVHELEGDLVRRMRVET